ncbi:enoyl-CoA hydratase/isomerase family protein [Acidiferrimicrobium sp. IK]|uniref:enoyl-CoA hydratase-related protein n=1 Tax=Acidiferrimicrobium sp. IK TaxID=2871700 RepID=UPI0021CB6412|nr:enoyl-CoA hydratase-related protein [Acidiferrimicrobium sp. IK]MCU4186369.1 enoyl-CoA hydratase/isomerase family protein [Acidiferrimicrobium sp. IK]
MAGDASSVVGYDVAASVATITLDHQERRNAWSPDMERQYFAALDRASADRDVRAVVVTGAGRWFCPGLDSERLVDAAGDTGLRLEGRRSQHYAWTVPKPMIAAINGACAGIGLVQALVCDVRFMARGARLSTAYAKLGVPAEHGLSWIMPRLVGVEMALDLLLSARPVEAEEAKAIGLVSRVCDADSVLGEATAYAETLAATCSPRSMAAIRRQVWGDLSRGYTEANEGWFAAMRDLNRPTNPDFAEGVAAFVAKRPPEFSPLAADAWLPPLPPFAAQ